MFRRDRRHRQGTGRRRKRTDLNTKIRARARRKENVMSKRIMIGLFALSVVAVLRTEANAGCAVIAGFQICASWITGGSEVGLVTTQGFTAFAGVQSCAVTTNATPPSTELVALQAPASPVNFKLAGTVPTTASPQCGLDSPNDQCDIRGVVFCGAPQPPI